MGIPLSLVVMAVTLIVGNPILAVVLAATLSSKRRGKQPG